MGKTLDQALYAAARDEFGKSGIGLEIVPWIAGPGKTFLQEKFGDLAEEFIKTLRVRVVDENTILVNLNAPPKYPVKKQQGVNVLGGMGWVTVEKRADGLYVNGRRVILHVEPGQKHTCEVLGGETLLNAFRHHKPVLHPNILDALIEHPHLLPDDTQWSYGDRGYPLSVCFWAVTYTDSFNREYVRCLVSRFDEKERVYRRSSDQFGLSHPFGESEPAAMLEG